MRTKAAMVAVLLAAAVASTAASADDKKPSKPYEEAISKGNAAYIAHDWPGAVSQFQSAIKADTELLLGFLRLGEAQLASGKLDEADSAWTTALNKKGSLDDHAKILFLLADLRERQHKLQAAIDAWKGYQAYLTSNSKAKGFPATAEERIKRIDQRMKDEVTYGAVKDRVEKRKKDLEQEAIDNAKKDKLNR